MSDYIASSPSLEAKEESPYTRRFGETGKIVSDALHRFSLDVCAVIMGYVVCGMPRRDGKPVSLFTFGGKEKTGPESEIRGIVCTSDRELWFTDTSGHRVLMFDSAGNFLRSSEGAMKLNMPSAIVQDSNGEIFVAGEQATPCTVCDSKGRYLRTFGGRGADGKGLPQLDRSVDLTHYRWSIAVDGKGGVFIGGSTIFAFQRDGTFIRRFERGLTPRAPYSLAVNPHVDGDGELYCARFRSEAIEVYDLKGKFLRSFDAGVAKNFGWSYKCSIAFGGPTKHLFLAWTGHAMGSLVQVYERNSVPTHLLLTSFEFRQLLCIHVDDEYRILLGCTDGVHVLGFPL